MRRLLSALLASLALLVASLAVPSGPAAAQTDDEAPERLSAVALLFFRFGGADRYETSLIVTEAVAATFGGKLDSIVLVSGERWTDAVVAAPLAGSLNAPVLMTPPDELRQDALDFMKNVGVNNAVVVGATSGDSKHGPGRGVSDDVLAALREAGVQTERVEGSDRFGTAVAVAQRLTPGAMPGLGRTAIVASGDVFADALVAGPFAFNGHHPLLLTTPTSLHPQVAAYLDEADIDHVVVMGGSAALDETVEASLVDAGIRVTRLAGATRYDTAVKAAELVEDRDTAPGRAPCFATEGYGLARARVPFDSFSAAPFLGRFCMSLLLTDPGKVPVPTAIYLDKKLVAQAQADDDNEVDAYVLGVFIFGGNAAVSQESLGT